MLIFIIYKSRFKKTKINNKNKMTETVAQEAVPPKENYYVLRQASIQDISQILSLYKSTWEPFAETNKSISDYLEFVLKDLENLNTNYLTKPKCNFWVVTSYCPETPTLNNAQILSFVGVCPSETNDKAMELVRLVVAPEVRRGGIASRLLEHVEMFARKQSGCEFLTVTTGTFLGPGTLEFYTQNGFRETKRTDNKDIVLVEFTKSLIIGSWLKSYRQSAKIINNLMITDEDQILVDVTIPEAYDEELPEFGDIPGHTKQTWNDINEYFLGLLEDSYRIVNINGKSTLLEENWLNCDYCNASEQLWMRHCDECDKNMCNLCWEEKNEEIAIRNGAQNWFDRKDALLACFGEWFCNRKDEKDLCLECSITEEGKKIIAQDESWKKCVIGENNLCAFFTGFGSLLEWVPILVDAEEHHMMMYNIVPGSKNYHRTALVAVDDHGRLGYHMVDGELEEIITKLNECVSHYREVKVKHGCSWETHYNAPIPYFMGQQGWEIYYG
jgi:N-acetylglutamate synthase-like GNAT family acetyltransferase